MHVVFVEPAFPRNQRDFVRALHAAGAKVTAIGEAPLSALDGELRRWLHGYEQVGSVCDEAAMIRTVRGIQKQEWVDKLETTIEAHMLTAAAVREACSIPGLTVRQTVLCRDKPQMKEFLRQAGVPCAASTAAETKDEVRAFARVHGYPLILKPRASAGADGTIRVDNEQELEIALGKTALERGHSIAVEEFIEGHEGFYDTLWVEGELGHEFISHYYPNVLHAMRTRWISPQIVATNRVELPSYQELKAMGQQVIRALGLQTAATHMEWFYGPKGLKFSEIGARPPGVRQWDLYNFGNDIDLYFEWAVAVVHGRVAKRPSRRFASGLVALRPDRDGRIAGYEGVETVRQRHGQWIIDMHLPPPGQRTQPVEAGFMANAWVRARHPDYDSLRAVLDDIGRTIRVRAVA